MSNYSELEKFNRKEFQEYLQWLLDLSEDQALFELKKQSDVENLKFISIMWNYRFALSGLGILFYSLPEEPENEYLPLVYILEWKYETRLGLQTACIIYKDNTWNHLWRYKI